ncbi:MAG TPA: (Fe-S)-binding protein [Candidatus Methanoperedenaceae archaeon]|nr:(Fe-S)-binding protein [Candidatus Methanoperedenaceae archaeon]
MELTAESISCYQCGKCTSICPVRRVSKTSPRGAIYSSNVYSDRKDSVWTCLTCGLCPMECPQEVDFLKFVREQRAGRKPLDVAHQGVFTELASLMSVLDGKAVIKTGLASAESKYGYFPGCAGYFDLLLHDVGVKFSEVGEASVMLLAKIGIAPKIMEMKCCGHDVLWQGKKDVFDRLAGYNTDYIRKSGIDTLVTGCAECYRTFSLDYHLGELGVRVVHIAELLPGLGLRIGEKVTYHDPCRLGRHMGVYDAPRAALTANGVELVEMAHSRKDALCCGVSNFMNCNEQTKALRMMRLDEASATGARTMITTCTKCLAHLNCLRNDGEPEKTYSFEVVDLATYLARHL